MLAHRAESAGTKAEIVGAKPVGAVVLRFATRLGIIGDLILGVTGARQRIHGHLEELRIALVILLEGAAGQLAEIFGVLLVSEAIARDVLRAEGDRFLQRLAPLLRRLP